jgi:hypothetical protein
LEAVDEPLSGQVPEVNSDAKTSAASDLEIELDGTSCVGTAVLDSELE